MDSTAIIEGARGLAPILTRWGIDLQVFLAAIVSTVFMTALAVRVFGLRRWWKFVAALVIALAWSVSTVTSIGGIFVMTVFVTLIAAGYAEWRNQGAQQ